MIYDPDQRRRDRRVADAVPGQHDSREPPLADRAVAGVVPSRARPTADIQNNYLAVLPQKINNDSTTNKVDLNLSDKNRVFALFSTGKYTTNFTGSYAPGPRRCRCRTRNRGS